MHSRVLTKVAPPSVPLSTVRASKGWEMLCSECFFTWPFLSHHLVVASYQFVLPCGKHLGVLKNKMWILLKFIFTLVLWRNEDKQGKFSDEKSNFMKEKKSSCKLLVLAYWFFSSGYFDLVAGSQYKTSYVAFFFPTALLLKSSFSEADTELIAAFLCPSRTNILH